MGSTMEEVMIDRKNFYSERDYPTASARKRMWQAVEAFVGGRKQAVLFAFDRRSFVYGLAASMILMFTSVGVYTTVKNALEYSQPQAIRLDNAYQSAIHEFEEVAARGLLRGGPTTNDEIVSDKREQIRQLDAAINQLRRETNARDLSTLKRARLRELFSMKLKLLQEMVEQGEIEL